MQSFQLKSPALVLLLGVFAVITVLLVLPDVDPLDTAFQRNTSPLALHSRSHSIPQFELSTAPVRLVGVAGTSLGVETRDLPIPALAEFLQVLHHSFRC